MSAGARLHASTALLVIALSYAASAAAAPTEATQEAIRAAWKAAAAVLVRGPASITLADQATLALPGGLGFIPQKQAAEVLRTMGNRTDKSFIGLIVPTGQKELDWLVTARYEPSGYIKDDDAKKNWDADKLLQTLREGTEAANADRERLGIPPITVTRWVESPLYESGAHQLVWSAEVRRKDGPDPDPTVNYNTYVLGREGYISLNLITAASSVEQEKPVARQLIGAVKFNSGKTYGEFNAATDKIAAYGLAALVAGVAAKKLGLLALAAAFIVKFAKVIFVAVAAFGAGIARWLKARATGKNAAS